MHDPSPPANPRALTAERLVRAYGHARGELLDDAHGGALVSVRTTPAGAGAPERARALRKAALWALDDHIERRLASVERRLSGDAAAGAEFPAELRAAIGHARSSLVRVPRRGLLLLAVLAVCAASLALNAILRAISYPGRTLDSVIATANGLVRDLSERVLTLNVTEVPDALEQIGRTQARTLAFVVVILALATYIVLRPLTSSLRVKRTLLVRAGAYALEAEALGVRAARERPVDLIVLGLPWLLPLYVGSYMLGDAALEAGARAGQWITALILLIPTGARLGRLAGAWRRASRPDAAPVGAPPRKVRVPARGLRRLARH
jgi:hypothetical protein